MIKLLDIFVRGEPEPMPRPRFRVVFNGGILDLLAKTFTAAVAEGLGPGEIASTLLKVFRSQSHAGVYYQERYPNDDARAGQSLPWFVWRKRVIDHVTSAGRFTQATGAMKLDLDFYFERPERLLTAKASIGKIMHTSKPDTDNLVKLVKDVLTVCGVWKDDAQVCRESVWKDYAARGEPAGVRIVVHQLEQDQPALFDVTPKPKEEEPVHPAVVRAPLTYGRPGPRPMNPN